MRRRASQPRSLPKSPGYRGNEKQLGSARGCVDGFQDPPQTGAKRGRGSELQRAVAASVSSGDVPAAGSEQVALEQGSIGQAGPGSRLQRMRRLCSGLNPSAVIDTANGKAAGCV
jgi:hypothetical protein